MTEVRKSPERCFSLFNVLPIRPCFCCINPFFCFQQNLCVLLLSTWARCFIDEPTCEQVGRWVHTGHRARQAQAVKTTGQRSKARTAWAPSTTLTSPHPMEFGFGSWSLDPFQKIYFRKYQRSSPLYSSSVFKARLQPEGVQCRKTRQQRCVRNQKVF